jgi:hypothetical protein
MHRTDVMGHWANDEAPASMHHELAMYDGRVGLHTGKPMLPATMGSTGDPDRALPCHDERCSPAESE